MALAIEWLLVLLGRSGGAKWKISDNREHDAHVTLRSEHEALLKQLVVVPQPIANP